MRRRWTRITVLSLLALVAAGCTDSIGPGDGGLRNMTLDFCSGDAPLFFAVMNEGGDWTPLTANAGDTYDFQATPKVAIAFVHQIGTQYSTEVIYATAEELAPLSGVACTESTGAKTLNGNVAGVSAGADAWITMADQTMQVFPPPNGFSLFNLPSGPLDIVANRDAFTVSNTIPDRVIVRRGVNLTNGSTIPTLDFSAAEAVTPASNSLTISGLSASETNSIDVRFSTATTIDHDLYYVQDFTAGPQVFYSIPLTLTQAGDLHTIDLYAEDASGHYHGVLQFYRAAADLTAAMGPLLSTPSYSTIANTPVERIRMTLPVQPQYNSFSSVGYVQSGATSRTVFVTGTAAYFDGPTTWTLDIPDLATVSGFPINAGLQSGVSTSAAAEAYGGSAAVFFGAGPEEGETLKYAGSGGMTAAMQGTAIRARPQHDMHQTFAGFRATR